MKTVSAVTALALTIATAIPAGYAANNNISSAGAGQITKDLGVPSKSQSPPSRIISGDAGRNTMRVAYACYYRYVYDAYGNLYLQRFCIW
jgi:hypothetical protein